MAKRPDLVIVNGELSGRRFSLDAIPLRLGRSSMNDIHVPDEELSRNHCLFEPSGETGLRVTDLASANGTMVNGEAIGSDPVELKAGDIIEVGQTRIRVGDDPAAAPAPAPVGGAGVVDLGLGAAKAVGGTSSASAKRRSPLANVLWAVAVLVAVGAMALILLAPQEEPAPAPKAVSEEQPVVREVSYEKVRADSNGIFRYALVFAADGTLSVKIDDTSNNRRMPAKRQALSAAGLEELNDILAWKRLKELDREYVGIEPDPPALDSQVLKVVYSTRVQTVRVVNTDEPEAFAAIREKLEAFSKSELGVWAIAYSRERLVELAEQAVQLGNAKWEERDVNYGNLAAAIAAYSEALFYLETVNPKPECATAASTGLERAKKELDTRYSDQRFLADKALNLSQWETARDELKVLLEMVPDRRDDRNRDARQKLVSAETNLKKKGGK